MEQEKISRQFFYIAQGSIKRLSVQKRGRTEVRMIYVETVEISPMRCCFELEGEEAFQAGDLLEFHFDMEDYSVHAGARILDSDKCRLLDEGYERKPLVSYCAQFDGELDSSLFRRVMGIPRKCRSSSEH